MNTDKAKTSFSGIQFEDSKITDEPHLPRLKAGVFAFFVREQASRCRAKLDYLDKAFWRMSSQVQDEILVQIGYICHTALSRQAKHLAFARDPGIVGATVHINLGDGNYLVSDAALLVIPMIGFIPTPPNFRTAKFERLGQCEGHRVEVDIEKASIQSDDRQPGRMSLL